MNFKARICPVCGGRIIEIDNNFKCEYCETAFDRKKEKDDFETVIKYLENEKLERLANARHNLYDAVHEEYLSRDKIRICINEVKKIYPDDFMSSLYDAILNEDKNVLNGFINNLDLEKHSSFKEEVIYGTIKSFDYINAISLKNFIDVTCDVLERNKYNTEIEKLVEKAKNGVYNLDIDRDFFICYSSKDIKKVDEIVSHIEESGLTCFVALRNLRHGVGASENYKTSLEKAMRNSKGVIFISSENSRDMSCDAIRFELPYLKDLFKDKERIEYLIEDYGAKTTSITRTFLKQVFDGLEWCKSIEDLDARCASIVFGKKKEEKKEEKKEPVSLKPDLSKIKYCFKCGTVNDVDSKYCKSCGSDSFAKDTVELVKSEIDKRNDKLKIKKAEIKEKELSNIKRRETELSNASITMNEKIAEANSILKALKIDLNNSLEETEKQKKKNDFEIEHIGERIEEIKKKANDDELKLRLAERERLEESGILRINDGIALFGVYPKYRVSTEESKKLAKYKFDKSTWKLLKDGIYYFDVSEYEDTSITYRGIHSEKRTGAFDENETVWYMCTRIRWQVASESEYGVVLVSEDILDCRPFNKRVRSYGITPEEGLNRIFNYEYSDIREWLSTDFLNTAFTDEEKRLISCDDFLSYRKYNEGKYDDKVAILSTLQIIHYNNKLKKIACPSEYALNVGFDEKKRGEIKSKSWWTSTSVGNESMEFVDENGNFISYKSCKKAFEEIGVRVACYIRF